MVGLYVFALCIMVLVLPFMVTRVYSSSLEIGLAVKKRDDELLGENPQETNDMSGGADGDDNDKQNDVTNNQESSSDNSPDDNDSDDEQTSTGKKRKVKIFKFRSQLKKFIMLYKHFILIALTLMFVLDVQKGFGNFAAGILVFAGILLYMFTALYKPLQPKLSDRYTNGLVGTKTATKKCEPVVVPMENGEQKQWYEF